MTKKTKCLDDFYKKIFSKIKEGKIQLSRVISDSSMVRKYKKVIKTGQDK